MRLSVSFYFMDYHQPIYYDLPLPDGSYTAELIDPWEMTTTPLSGTFTGRSRIKLSGRPTRRCASAGRDGGYDAAAGFQLRPGHARRVVPIIQLGAGQHVAQGRGVDTDWMT